MPSFTTPTGLGPPARRRCRVFVSYAHVDAKPEPAEFQVNGLVGRFVHVELKNIRQRLADKGMVLHDDEIFFDSDRLNREPQWKPAIERAVQDCELLIFLVSSHAMASDYCIRHEVGPVVERIANAAAVPAVATIVLRTPTDGWTDRELPNNHRLGQFASGGLPKNEIGNLLAVASWSNRDEAWSSVSRDLFPLIETTLFPHSTITAPSRSTQAGADRQPLTTVDLPLPYLCNQEPLTRAFEDAADEWQRGGAKHAMLVLLAGGHNDAPEHFARRLQRHHLPRRLKTIGVAVHTDRPPPLLKWPQAPAAGTTLRHSMPLLRALFEALDDDLVPRLAVCTEFDQAAQVLCEHLRARTHAAVLMAWLPDRDLGKDLPALLRFIDAARPEGQELARLVLICVGEARGSVWPRAVRKSSQALVAALEPMAEIDVAALTKWHKEHGLHERVDLDRCETLFHQLARAGRMGAREFARHFQTFCEGLRSGPEPR
ncbi:toll/interleukin-1 receptor domain-containing protein [Ideonella sp. A 288]|uniref:toll/interleukin-1 receptor domain-containing protein n=1 Tax=Ideonella sp. A 288 TaxID=1962181 RepID=UPI00118696DF|nr:toll/interleukin-1 receptor domain-containing protein [Ideonella sp. A 288]